MSIISSESYQSSNSDWDNYSLEEKINSLDYHTKSYDRYLEKAHFLKNSIENYKKKHGVEDGLVLKKITELQDSLNRLEKNMKRTCEDRLQKFDVLLEPYLNNPTSGSLSSKEVREKIGSLFTKILEVENESKRTLEISENAIQDHKLLNRMERKQNDAIRRFENVERVENLGKNMAKYSEMKNLIDIPALLLALAITPEISNYYKNIFQDLQSRICTFLEEFKSHEKLVEMEILKNGEITSKSLIETAEYPIDSSSEK